MALTEIKASKKIDGVDKSAAIAFDFGDDVNAAIEKFGGDVVFANFKRSATITGQAAIRRALEAGKSEEEIASMMQSWKPGVALERVVDPVASLMSKWDSYSPEEQADIIKKLKGKK